MTSPPLDDHSRGELRIDVRGRKTGPLLLREQRDRVVDEAILVRRPRIAWQTRPQARA
ncbi:hypothetical protein ABT065_37525 [Streptomyces sp. NPDC002764]|uniref:hypothetical protein n=1 Tax=Streptomyces sp. NPDC002764 TaxID=3154428 RepID=UPI003328777D